MRLKAITQFLKDLGSGLKHFYIENSTFCTCCDCIVWNSSFKAFQLTDCKGRILQTELYNESPERDCNCGTKRQYLR